MTNYSQIGSMFWRIQMLSEDICHLWSQKVCADPIYLFIYLLHLSLNKNDNNMSAFRGVKWWKQRHIYDAHQSGLSDISGRIIHQTRHLQPIAKTPKGKKIYMAKYTIIVSRAHTHTLTFTFLSISSFNARSCLMSSWARSRARQK